MFVLESPVHVEPGDDSQHWADSVMPSEQVTVRSTHVGVAGAALAVLEDDILRGKHGVDKRKQIDELRLILLADEKARAALEARRWYLIITYDEVKVGQRMAHGPGIMRSESLPLTSRISIFLEWQKHWVLTTGPNR